MKKNQEPNRAEFGPIIENRVILYRWKHKDDRDKK